MKSNFLKLCCMGMALLFSLNFANASLSVKADEHSSVIVEKEVAPRKSETQGNVVVTKEMLQELVDQRIKNAKSNKSAFLTLILAVFGGEFGLHRFYVGKVGTGLLYLFTGGLFGIGWFIDVVRILLEDFKDSRGLPIEF